MNLFDNFEENSFRVIILLADKNISNSLCNKLKRLAVIFVLIKFRSVVFKVYLWFACLFLNFLEEEIYIFVCSFFDVSSDIDIGDKRPGYKKVTQEFLEYLHCNDRLVGRYNHFEGYFCFQAVVFPFENIHILQEISKIDLN